MTNNALLAVDLSRYFGKTLALDCLNLQIPYGEVFGLMGPNGAGKTTALRLFCGVLRPSTGFCLVDGYDTVKESDKVKEISGYLPETSGIYKRLTAREFLFFVGDLYRIEPEVYEKKVDYLCSLLSFEHDSTAMESLSRGMKQKVLIAAALLNDPKLVFFDEPLATLDPIVGFRLKKLIRDLAGENGTRSVVVSSHLPNLIEEVSDRVAFLDRGRITEIGTVNELLEKHSADSLEEAFITAVGPSSRGNS